MPPPVSRSYVFFHAHPDDEALLTAGTMARLAAEGHRVVLVTATAGENGLAAPALHSPAVRSTVLTAPPIGLGHVRMAELQASAAALGCARVEWLGYGDSGLHGTAAPAPGGPQPFASADLDEAAGKLAQILDEERATFLSSYDAAGGYGHPDHVQVHRVAAKAARLAGTRTVMEATVDRDLLLRALRLAQLGYRFPPEFDVGAFRHAYTSAAEITHRVNVRRYAKAKRASMAAHVSQATGGTTERTLAALLRLPKPLFRLLLGTEWFVRRTMWRRAL